MFSYDILNKPPITMRINTILAISMTTVDLGTDNDRGLIMHVITNLAYIVLFWLFLYLKQNPYLGVIYRIVRKCGLFLSEKT